MDLGSPTQLPNLEFQKPLLSSSLECQGSSCTSIHVIGLAQTRLTCPSLPRVTLRLPWFSSASRTHYPLANEGKGRGNSEWSLAHYLTYTDRPDQSEELRQPRLPQSNSAHPPPFCSLPPHRVLFQLVPFHLFHSTFQEILFGKEGTVGRIGADHRREFLREEPPIPQRPGATTSFWGTQRSHHTELRL